MAVVHRNSHNVLATKMLSPLFISKGQTAFMHDAPTVAVENEKQRLLAIAAD
jgi:hypothetical protein